MVVSLVNLIELFVTFFVFDVSVLLMTMTVVL